MKYLLVGLGNIGAEYANTRHNIGFDVLDALAKASNIFFSTARLGDLCELKHKGKRLFLLKPNTYMNLSGKALVYWMQKENIPLENILVIVDDLALPVGALRLRGSGSSAGHNGLKSIEALLGHQNYARLKFGIGSDFPKGRQADFVLGRWETEEKDLVETRIPTAVQAVMSFCTAGLANTMGEFNKK